MIEGLWFILSALDVCSQYLLFTLFLKHLHVRPQILVTCYILQFLTYAVNSVMPAVLIIHTLGLILMTGDFTGSLKLKGVSVFTIYLLGMAAELTVYFLLLSRLESKPLLLINLLTSLVFAAFYFLIKAVKRKYQKPGAYIWAYFILFFSFLITIAFGLRESGWLNNLPWIISMLLLSALFMMEKSFDYRHVKQTQLEEAIYTVQLSAYEQQLQQLKESHEQLRQLRHDFRNHLLVLANKTAMQTEQYVQELSCHYGIELEQGDCSFLEHFLRRKEQEARRRGVRMEYSKRYPNDGRIRDCDVIILLGNLLDNAIEAAQSSVPAEVKCTIEYRAYTLRLVITNSSAPVKFEHGRPKATRKERGTGLNCVQRVVETYGGCVQYAYANGMFTASVILFESVNSVEGAVNSA